MAHERRQLDLTNGVEHATMVAAARAVAKPGPMQGRRSVPEDLVRAVGVEFFTQLVVGELDFASIGGDGDLPGCHIFTGAERATSTSSDVASEVGIRQMVSGFGPDSRVYRLPWADGTIVYEIDIPEVIEFKRSALASVGAYQRPNCAPSSRSA